MNDVSWNDVTEDEIQKELAYWKGRGATAVWVVPCRYADGKVTCVGIITMPSSNLDRREYVLECKWSRK